MCPGLHSFRRADSTVLARRTCRAIIFRAIRGTLIGVIVTSPLYIGVTNGLAGICVTSTGSASIPVERGSAGERRFTAATSLEITVTREAIIVRRRPTAIYPVRLVITHRMVVCAAASAGTAIRSPGRFGITRRIGEYATHTSAFIGDTSGTIKGAIIAGCGYFPITKRIIRNSRVPVTAFRTAIAGRSVGVVTPTANISVFSVIVARRT